MVEFQKIVDENLATLDLYTTAITRAHGKNHPEAFDVREIFEKMQEKIEASEKPNLTSEFQTLREVTDDYAIPSDVCETYEAVYTMLSEADKIYHKE